MDDRPLVSVITVVKDGEAVIEPTLRSVAAQLYSPLEYVVVDGGSRDNTIAIVERYRASVSLLVSEPDRGLFDAMNKGIRVSRGKWLLFMNAGDELCSVDTLCRIDLALADRVTVLYGDYIAEGMHRRPMDPAVMRVGIIFGCHQAMLFNRARCGRELRFDTRYPTYADYELVLRLSFRYPGTFSYVPVPIARYLGGGVSSRSGWRKRIDTLRIVGSHSGVVGIARLALDRIARIRRG